MKNYEKVLKQKTESFMERMLSNPIKTVFSVVVLLGVLGFGFSIIGGLFSTATTVVSAPGRVLNKTLETNNIIQSYEWYFDYDASFKSRVNQIAQFKNILSGETDKDERSRVRMEMAAIQQTCRDIATKYNANSQKMNKSIFKGWSLPDVLSINQCEG